MVVVTTSKTQRCDDVIRRRDQNTTKNQRCYNVVCHLGKSPALGLRLHHTWLLLFLHFISLILYICIGNKTDLQWVWNIWFLYDIQHWAETTVKYSNRTSFNMQIIEMTILKLKRRILIKLYTKQRYLSENV